jgi:hypothetical protein
MQRAFAAARVELGAAGPAAGAAAEGCIRGGAGGSSGGALSQPAAAKPQRKNRGAPKTRIEKRVIPSVGPGAGGTGFMGLGGPLRDLPAETAGYRAFASKYRPHCRGCPKDILCNDPNVMPPRVLFERVWRSSGTGIGAQRAALGGQTGSWGSTALECRLRFRRNAGCMMSYA